MEIIHLSANWLNKKNWSKNNGGKFFMSKELGLEFEFFKRLLLKIVIQSDPKVCILPNYNFLGKTK